MFTSKPLIRKLIFVFIIAIFLFNSVLPTGKAEAKSFVTTDHPAGQFKVQGVNSTDVSAGLYDDNFPLPEEQVNIPALDPAVPNAPDQGQLVEVDTALSLDVSIDPPVYLPGKTFKLNWKIKGSNAEMDAKVVQVQLHAPDGVRPTDQSLAQKFDASGNLKMPNGVKFGANDWNRNVKSSQPFQISLDLIVNDQVVDTTAVYMDAGVYTTVSNKDNNFDSADKKVHLNIPANASTENLVFSVRQPSPNRIPPVSLSWAPFEIVAAGVSTGKGVDHFNKPITIQVNYKDEDLLSGSAEDLMLYYYDETTKDW